tara:strand:+ start:629 stop:1399 length:771 start_codon:yes stop_codon:yes gene_type:complete
VTDIERVEAFIFDELTVRIRSAGLNPDHVEEESIAEAKEARLAFRAIRGSLERLRARVAELEASDHSQEYKQRIQELAVLPENWDGYGAPPPSMPALLAAEKLLHSKAGIFPMPDGGIQVEWPDFIDLAFGPDGSQDYDPECSADGWKKRSAEAREWFNSILGPEIKAERDRQDAAYGPAHDDKHDLVDWLNIRWGISRFVDRAAVAAGSARLKYELGDASGILYNPEENFEKAIIQIAALAVAAVQSSRRKRNAA